MEAWHPFMPAHKNHTDMWKGQSNMHHLSSEIRILFFDSEERTFYAGVAESTDIVSSNGVCASFGSPTQTPSIGLLPEISDSPRQGSTGRVRFGSSSATAMPLDLDDLDDEAGSETDNVLSLAGH